MRGSDYVIIIAMAVCITSSRYCDFVWQTKCYMYSIEYKIASCLKCMLGHVISDGGVHIYI